MFRTNYVLRSLGDQRRGIRLGNYCFRGIKNLEVWYEPREGLVELRSATFKAQVFTVEKKPFVKIFGQAFLFEPFLRLPWMARMIGL